MRPAIVLAATMLACAALPLPAEATTTTTTTAASPVLSAPRVVAEGLAHPRGIRALADGVVLVAESGREGTEPCLPRSPGSAGAEQCLSRTGAVSLFTHGRKTTLVGGTASLGTKDGTFAHGPSDMLLTPKGLVVVMGLANNPTGREALGEAGRELGTLAYATRNGLRPFADLAAHEIADNPDGGAGFAGLWCHPYAAMADGDGFLVADAGANALLRVARDGAISVVAVFPAQTVTTPNGPAQVQAVPTSVVRGPRGSYYVSEYTGYPYTGKVARIWHVVPGQQPRVFAQGFSPILDMDVDARGRLHVLEVEYTGSPYTVPPPAGRVTRVERDGTAVPVVTEGLTMPSSLSFTRDTLYVADNSVSANGRLLAYRLP
ncbi:ScyD/ScyE family protein [Nonomuraea sp. H19]|uniref:ScyD/ScyE family protein n=1 Tax=Nonomuraea sp. H19 TaxID=3452206 RepID=UPI003F8B920B